MSFFTASIFTTLETVQREAMIFNISLAAGKNLVLKYDADPVTQTFSRRIFFDATVVDFATVYVGSECMSCTIREDIIDTFTTFLSPAKRKDTPWTDAFVFLPLGHENHHIVAALATQQQRNSLWEKFAVATVATIINGETFRADIQSTTSLADRELHLSTQDERTVAEFLCGEVESADLIVATGKADPLLHHLQNPDADVLTDLHQIDIPHLTSARYDRFLTRTNTDPYNANVNHDVTEDVWTIELYSERPLNPEKLYHRIEEFAQYAVHIKGVFGVPNRPDEICEWHGCGGQLWIAPLDKWDEGDDDDIVFTRLVATGIEEDNMLKLMELFEDVLTTEEEMADGGLAWLGREDVLEPWLGNRHDNY